MFILSQNKEKLYNLNGHIEGIGYEEAQDYKKGKKENPIRHTIMVFDGCAEEVAKYETKEDCLLVLYGIYKAIEKDAKCVELPNQEETKELRELINQITEEGKRLADDITELLKDVLQELKE